MSSRILQGNHLYRRIQYRNIFQTFSKSYKKQMGSHNKQNREKMVTSIEYGSIVMNETGNNSTITQVLTNRNDKYMLKSDRKQSELSNPVQLHQKYSTKLLPTHQENTSKLTQIDLQSQYLHNQRKFSRNCRTSMSSKNKYSEGLLQKWNQRKKNQDFKLKSCLEKVKITYQCPVNQTEFSTLQLQKKSELLTKKGDRYHQRWRLGHLTENNKDIQNQIIFGGTRKGAFIISRYSKFAQQGLKSNTQLFTKTRK